MLNFQVHNDGNNNKLQANERDHRGRLIDEQQVSGMAEQPDR